MFPYGSDIRSGRTAVTPRTFVRDLPYSILQNIARQLDPDGTSTTWRDLASKIPQGPTNPAPRFTNTDIKHFEMCSRHGQSATLKLLSAWATSNVTAQNLVDVLRNLNLPKLADMIIPPESTVPYNMSHGMVLPGRHPAPPPYDGINYDYRQSEMMAQPVKMPQPHVAAPISSSFSRGTRSREPVEHDSIPYRHPTENCTSTANSIDISEHLSLEDLSLEKDLPSFSYFELSELTSNFNESCKLGEGAFGSVFSGHLTLPKCKVSKSDARKIAIKRLKLETPDLAIAVAEQFKKEIHIISELAHENILPLVGYSCDGPELCLVYDFMFNGSLSFKLQCCREGTSQLSVSQRMQIAEGSAAGIEYLHKKKLVHRDIKSSNILLDTETRPRISDFGLIRSVLTARDKTSTVTTKPIGTPMYMAPEAYRGEVSTAMDVFGFGLVLLELLTSKAVYEPDRDPQGLDSFVTEKCEDDPEIFMTLIDKNAGVWRHDIAMEMYELVEESLNYKRKKRPTMTQVLQKIQTLRKSL